MKKNIDEFSKLPFGEEVTNAITHGVMALLILGSLPFCAVLAYNRGGWIQVVGVSIFLISVFLMFITSCLYHSMDYNSTQKLVFRILDHCMIYVAIAGSYTPVALIVIGGWQGIVIIILQWFAVLVGVLYKSIAQRSIPKLSVGIYMIMGWSVVFFLPSLLNQAKLVFLLLIALGGLFYSFGAGFYLSKKKYTHAIWHFFINFAALSHMGAIILFLN